MYASAGINELIPKKSAGLDHLRFWFTRNVRRVSLWCPRSWLHLPLGLVSLYIIPNWGSWRVFELLLCPAKNKQIGIGIDNIRYRKQTPQT